LLQANVDAANNRAIEKCFMAVVPFVYESHDGRFDAVSRRFHHGERTAPVDSRSTA
jgi:hypothetical protein